jgi:hypothetical protein
MASTKAPGNRVAWGYTDNDGTTWRVSAKAAYVLDGTDGAKFGGAAALSSVRGKPAGLQMRAVICTSAAGVSRAVVCYSTTATLWTTPGTSVTLNENGVDVAYTSTSDQRPERRGKQAKQAA